MKNLIAILFVVIGAAVLWYGVPGQQSGLKITRQRDIIAGDTGFPEFDSYFQANRLRIFMVASTSGHQLEFQQVRYTDNTGDSKTALLYPLPASSTSIERSDKRAQAWQQLLFALKQLPAQPTVLLSWWDNSQRIHFYTGSRVWMRSPVADMFVNNKRSVWQQLSGGFTDDIAAARQFADWLLMDAEVAVKAIKTQFQPTPVRLLVSVDDLSRLNEIAALSSRPVAFETRLFKVTDNLHSLIAQVKRWADDGATGSYLIQKISATQIRAWRITSSAGEQALLARLLPFTSSLTAPLDDVQLLYRSKPDGFLSLYQLID